MSEPKGDIEEEQEEYGWRDLLSLSVWIGSAQEAFSKRWLQLFFMFAAGIYAHDVYMSNYLQCYRVVVIEEEPELSILTATNITASKNIFQELN